MIHPQAQALLDQIAAAGLPPMNQLSVTQARSVYRERRHATQPEPPEIGAVRDFQVQGIDVRSYRPAQVDAKADFAPLGALLYLHGGGWTIGDLDTHDTLCRSLSKQSGCAVYSVDYRMGPEYKFPLAVDDSWTVLNWLAANAVAEGVDAARIAVGGDSAGGNLAAVAALMARDHGGPALQFQLLIYPATDQRAQTPSHRRNGQGYLLTSELMKWFRDQYHANPGEYLDWRASPLLATDHSRLPPALVLTAGLDPLLDEGRAYAAKLHAAGVTVDDKCFVQQIHGFITMGRLLDQANEAVSYCAAALAKAIGNDNE